MMQHQRIKR